jgi:diguanylate cyclase (GGDEF)-like protein
MLDKLLLRTEKKMNEHLEYLVAERTKELNLTNQHLEEISNRDTLTGLYNRRYLINYLDLLFNSNSNKPFALLYIDANRFKSINDCYGHETGDKVLHTLGKRFSEHCTPNCTAFRIGGDEFAVIIENYKNKSYIKIVAEKILEILQIPVYVPPYKFTITASIGIALFPEDTNDKDILMRYADIAMYEVKYSNHKNDYLFFDKMLIEKMNLSFFCKMWITIKSLFFITNLNTVPRADL